MTEWNPFEHTQEENIAHFREKSQAYIERERVRKELDQRRSQEHAKHERAEMASNPPRYRLENESNLCPKRTKMLKHFAKQREKQQQRDAILAASRKALEKSGKLATAQGHLEALKKSARLGFGDESTGRHLIHLEELLESASSEADISEYWRRQRVLSMSETFYARASASLQQKRNAVNSAQGELDAEIERTSILNGLLAAEDTKEE